jgi:hypothetical protein
VRLSATVKEAVANAKVEVLEEEVAEAGRYLISLAVAPSLTLLASG